MAKIDVKEETDFFIKQLVPFTLLLTPIVVWFTYGPIRVGAPEGNGGSYFLSEDPRSLTEPFAGYRDKFTRWHRQAGEENVWQGASTLSI